MVIPLIPNWGWSYRPSEIRWGITFLSRFTGTAKPTPMLVPVVLLMAVLTPMTSPCASNSGPPEFPGLMAASV